MIKFRIKEFGLPDRRQFAIEVGQLRVIGTDEFYDFRATSRRHIFPTLEEAKVALAEIQSRYEKAEEFRKKSEPTYHYL